MHVPNHLAALVRKPMAQHWLKTIHKMVDIKRIRNALRAE